MDFSFREPNAESRRFFSMIGRMSVMFALSFALLGIAGPPAAVNPYALYEQTQEQWALQRYPMNLSYDLVVHIVENGTPATETYTSTYDAFHGKIRVNPISDYELAHPPDGRGVKFGAGIVGGPSIRMDKPNRPIDFLGIPLLEPTYSFGIGPHVAARKKTSEEILNEIRREFHDTVQPHTSTMKTIARIVSASKAYIIRYVGRENIRGIDCDHLALLPTRDAGRNRLRDIWIDHATHRSVRAIIGLNFVRGLGTKVPWRIDFGMADGALYVTSETALAPVQVETSSLQTHTYSSASIAFEHLQPQTKFSHFPSFFEPPASGAMLQEPGDFR